MPIRRKNLRLIGHRESSEQRDDLSRHLWRVAAKSSSAEDLCGFANVTFGWQEDKDVSGVICRDFFHGIGDAIEPVAHLAVVVFSHYGIGIVQRSIPNIDRIHAPRNLQHRSWLNVPRQSVAGLRHTSILPTFNSCSRWGDVRCTEVKFPPRSVGAQLPKMVGKPRGINRRRCDDHLQIAPLRQQTFEIPQQEVDVQRSLVRFVDDDRVVLIKKTIRLSFRQQDSVGHQTHARVRPAAVRKANAKTNFLPESAVHFFRQPRSDRSSCNTTRLSVSDDSRESASHFDQDLRQLRRFS